MFNNILVSVLDRLHKVPIARTSRVEQQKKNGSKSVFLSWTRKLCDENFGNNNNWKPVTTIERTIYRNDDASVGCDKILREIMCTELKLRTHYGWCNISSGLRRTDKKTMDMSSCWSGFGLTVRRMMEKLSCHSSSVQSLWPKT